MSSEKTHIMRLAPQDLRTSRVRVRSIRAADPMLRLVYFEALFALYEAGGELSSDPESLADVLGLPAEDVARCLPILDQIGRQRGEGGLIIDGGFVYNKRIRRELQEEMAFREQQRELGVRSGEVRRARAAGREPSLNHRSAKAQPTLNPPAPSPPPAPTPAPENSAVGTANTEPACGNVEKSDATAPTDQRPLVADYLREVAAVAATALGRKLRPAELGLAKGWYDAGIPFRIVATAIEHALPNARGQPRVLDYFAKAVRDEWDRVRRAM